MNIKTIIAVLMLSSIVLSRTSGAESFNCNSGSLNESEITICGYSDLMNMDELLVKIYTQVLGAGDESEKFEQRQWIRDRNNCKSNYGCISQEYRSRILDLANKLDLKNPSSVKDPMLFTTLDWISDSEYRSPTSCEEYKDINFDNKPEITCFPDCGGPACSWYFFASKNDEYIYFPELEKGSYDHLEIVPENQIPDYIYKKYPNIRSNILNGWLILLSQYSYQGTSRAKYYCNVDGRYNEC